MKFGSITTGIIADGLIFNIDAANRACYPKTGTTATDTIGSVDGTLTNGTAFSDTNKGTFDFDGTDDYIDLGSSLEINTNAAWSVSFWTNLDAYSPVYPAPFTLKTDESTGFCCFFSENTNYEGINFGSSANFTRFKTGGDISASLVGAWNNITLTYNGSGKTTNNNYNIYVNGEASPIVAAGAFGGVSNISVIGRIAVGNTFNGDIPNFIIYNRELSATEVLHNYNSLKSRFE